MPRYEYKAKDGPSKTVAGYMEADSKEAVIANLDMQGLVPVWVKNAPPAKRNQYSSILSRRVSFRDITLFTGQLASLLKSGVPILRAMSIISEQTENLRLSRIVEQLEQSIRDGNMLSVALADFSTYFPELYLSMVRAGEASGTLDVILERLAQSREKEEDIKRQLQSALAYPLLIVIVGFATVFGLLAFFLPKVVVLFRDYGDLPLPTKILINTSDFFSANWYWILLVLGLIAAILQRIASIEKGRIFFDKLKLRMPFIGKFITEAEISRFARTLALLIDAGMPVDRALGMSAQAMRNSVLREEVEKIRENTIERGEAVSSGMRRSMFFPAMITNMAAVGEEGGRLDESMNEAAVYYEKQCEQRSRLAISLVEPLMILLVGGLVGFIVAAMLLPIFKLGTGLH